MTYDVEFSLEAAAELVRIAGSVSPAAVVLATADSIRRTLESDPAAKGIFLSEGLYYLDDEPLRAFFVVDDASMIVEVTDFRII